LNRAIDIPSIANVGSETLFWNGIVDTCKRRRVTRLEVDSFASATTSIPPLPNETARHSRAEYVLDLVDGGAPRLATNHRRGVTRARKSGLTIRRGTDVAAANAHDTLMQASMVRRAARGEAVDLVPHERTTRQILESGAGELFQAADARGTVMSSVLVLRSALGGYYQSAGTSPNGMECGASPFLIVAIAESLAAEGARVFNLGGAGDDNPGLQRFKAGFGARVVSLEAASCCPSGVWRASLADRARRLQQRAHSFIDGLRGQQPSQAASTTN
jgi:hypothetical protein